MITKGSKCFKSWPYYAKQSTRAESEIMQYIHYAKFSYLSVDKSVAFSYM
jgi:hypothetical protein